jgi:hypothetical protein
MTNTTWEYQPLVPLAIVALVLFGMGAVVHLIQAIYYRTKFFTAFIVGAFSKTLHPFLLGYYADVSQP